MHQKISVIFGLAVWMVSANVYSDNTLPTLKLDCFIAFTDFQGIKHAAISKSVKLQGVKQQVMGSALVSQTDHFQFWAMIHSIQEMNGNKTINNFQVAIRDKKTGLFAHALSDSVYLPSTEIPKHARISLVEYHAKTLLEKGELFFECKT